MTSVLDALDLDRFPLQDLESPEGAALVARCRRELADHGLYNLEGLIRPWALRQIREEVGPLFENAAFTHKRSHNIYFDDDVPGLAADHPARRHCETVNHTICADQFPGSLLCRIYEWPPLAAFIAATMEMAELHTMADDLARLNVMSYYQGEALNWHFDRSEFTTTLLLQAPEAGGAFEYRTDLRSAEDPNYDGVARLLEGRDPDVEILTVCAGSLNIFKGKNTAHRVTPVVGDRARMIAVFSYYERTGVRFSEKEQLGFYGRVA